MNNHRRLLTAACLVLFTTTPLAATAAPKELGLGTKNEDFSKLPTFISSDTLSLNSKDRTFVYSGNVTVTQGDMTLTAQEMEGNYTEENRIQVITAKNQVTIVKGPGIRATGERAVYTADKGLLVLSENPAVDQQGSTLTADVIKIFLNENRSVAEGQVRVKLKEKTAAASQPAAVQASPTPGKPS